MKFITTKALILSAFTLVPDMHAQEPLLAIEFNQDDQEGFDLWPGVLSGLPNESTAEFTTDASFTSGQTTVLITSSTTINIPANRGSTNGTPPGYSYQNLYEDLIHAASPTGVLTLAFSGLNANQNYRFTLYAWDPGAGDGTDKEWTVTEGTSDQPVQSVNFLDPLIDNETFALVYDITTTNEGGFTLVDTDGLPQSAINGFKLEALGAAPLPLEITSMTFSPDDHMLTLTWNSVPCLLYTSPSPRD